MSGTERTVGNAVFKLDRGARALSVTGDLDNQAEEEFKRACLELVAEEPGEGPAKGPGEVFIDIAGVNFVCTACLGVLFLLYESASADDVRVRVRVNGKTAGICKMMGLDKVVSLDVAG